GCPVARLAPPRPPPGPRKRSADHPAGAPRRYRFCNVARIADAAVCNQRHVTFGKAPRDVGDGGDLRYADAGDDARRADGAGSDADLDSVRAMVHESLGPRCGGNIAPYYLSPGVRALHPPPAARPVLRVAGGGIHPDHVGPRLDYGGGSLLGALAHPDSGSHAQPSQAILAGVRVLGRFEDVFDGDQAAQLEAL